MNTTAKLLYGEPLAQQLRQHQTERVAAATITPRLVIIQTGNDLASTTYIKMKQRYGHSIGARVDHQWFGDAEEMCTAIQKLNADSEVHGIIVQLPLPNRRQTEAVVDTIDPAKDVDGLSDGSHFRSASAMAVLKLLEFYHTELTGVPVAVVGHGRLVGAPLAKLLVERGSLVTVCDTGTPDLTAKTRAARVVISATGAGSLIKPGMVQDGAIVVDVGTAEDAGALVGDIDPELLNNPTLTITPSKGGVGPVTVAMLFEQLLKAAGI